MSQMSSTPMLATAANAPNNAASTTSLFSDIENDAIHSRITSEKTIRICVQKEKWMFRFQRTWHSLHLMRCLLFIHCLLRKQCPRLMQRLLIKLLYLQKMVYFTSTPKSSSTHITLLQYDIRLLLSNASR